MGSLALPPHLVLGKGYYLAMIQADIDLNDYGPEKFFPVIYYPVVVATTLVQYLKKKKKKA